MVSKFNFIVNASLTATYSLLFETKEWPNVFPNCQRVEVIAEERHRQHFILYIRNNEALQKIDAVRTYEKDKSIRFICHCLQQAFEINWYFKANPKGTVIQSSCEMRSVSFSEKFRAFFVWRSRVRKNLLLIFQSVQLSLDTMSKTLKSATYLEHSIDIALPLDEAFDTICNPKLWPVLFPTAISINVLKDRPDLIEFELVEYLGAKEFFSHIHFHIDREKRMIYYQHYPPTSPFTHMISRWFFKDIGNKRTRFVIAREYKIKLPIIGDILAKTFIKKVIIDHVRDYHDDLKMYVKIANAKKWFENKEKYLLGQSVN
jgi:ribosome-associated toxin RatA of RatAB toxin-antitoxin module